MSASYWGDPGRACGATPAFDNRIVRPDSIFWGCPKASGSPSLDTLGLSWPSMAETFKGV